MSYQKAMRHARNVRKQRAQSKMHFGFDVGSGSWPSIRSNPICAAELDIEHWFKCRNDDNDKRQYARDCIRERIKELRELRAS